MDENRGKYGKILKAGEEKHGDDVKANGTSRLHRGFI